jgi:hypothetical protein
MDLLNKKFWKVREEKIKKRKRKRKLHYADKHSIISRSQK